jgi:hypothetical protein
LNSDETEVDDNANVEESKKTLQDTDNVFDRVGSPEKIAMSVCLNSDETEADDNANVEESKNGLRNTEKVTDCATLV